MAPPTNRFSAFSDYSLMPGELFSGHLREVQELLEKAKCCADFEGALSLFQGSIGAGSSGEREDLFSSCLQTLTSRLTETPVHLPLHTELCAMVALFLLDYPSDHAEQESLPLEEVTLKQLQEADLPPQARGAFILFLLKQEDPLEVDKVAALLSFAAIESLEEEQVNRIAAEFAALSPVLQEGLVASLSDESVSRLASEHQRISWNPYAHASIERIEEAIRAVRMLPPGLLVGIQQTGESDKIDLLLRLALNGTCELTTEEFEWIRLHASAEGVEHYLDVHNILPECLQLRTSRSFNSLWERFHDLRPKLLTTLRDQTFAVLIDILLNLSNSDIDYTTLLSDWHRTINVEECGSTLLASLLYCSNLCKAAIDFEAIPASLLVEIIFHNDELFQMMTESMQARALEGLVSEQSLQYVGEDLIGEILQRDPYFVAQHVDEWDREELDDLIRNVLMSEASADSSNDDEIPESALLVPLAKTTPALFSSYQLLILQLDEDHELVTALVNPSSYVADEESYWDAFQALADQLPELQNRVFALEADSPPELAQIHQLLQTAHRIKQEGHALHLQRRVLLHRQLFITDQHSELAGCAEAFRERSLATANQTREELRRAYPEDITTKFDSPILSKTFEAALACFEGTVKEAQDVASKLRKYPCNSFARLQVLFNSPLPSHLRTAMQHMTIEDLDRGLSQLKRLLRQELNELGWLSREISTPFSNNIIDTKAAIEELGLIQRLELLRDSVQGDEEVGGMLLSTYLGEIGYGGRCNIRLLDDCEELLGVSYQHLVSCGLGFEANAGSLSRLGIDLEELAEVLLSRDPARIQAHIFYKYLHIEDLETYWEALPAEVDDLDRLASHLDQESFTLVDFSSPV